MRSLKTILRFFVLALFLYVLLILPWPGVREGYRALYQTTGQALFGRFGAEGRVRYEVRPDDELYDLDVVLGKRGVGEVPAKMDTRRVGYVPVAVIVALVLATPVPWGRKWRALAWGFVLVNLFVVFRSTLQLLYLYGNPSPVRLYELSPFWEAMLARTYELFFVAPACTSVVPALVWVAVTFRREDINRILRGVSPGTWGQPD